MCGHKFLYREHLKEYGEMHTTGTRLKQAIEDHAMDDPALVQTKMEENDISWSSIYDPSISCPVLGPTDAAPSPAKMGGSIRPSARASPPLKRTHGSKSSAQIKITMEAHYYRHLHLRILLLTLHVLHHDYVTGLGWKLAAGIGCCGHRGIESCWSALSCSTSMDAPLPSSASIISAAVGARFRQALGTARGGTMARMKVAAEGGMGKGRRHDGWI